MIALRVVVLDVLTDQLSKVTFADRNDLCQAFRLDRSNESLGVGIQIRAAARELHRTHPRALERLSERPREERIAVVNEVAAVKKEAVLAVREIPSDLGHPSAVRRIGDPSDLDLARLQIDHEESEESNETSPRDHFDGEEVGGGDRSLMRAQEGLPTRRPPASWVDSVLGQDSLDRVAAHGVPEIR